MEDSCTCTKQGRWLHSREQAQHERGRGLWTQDKQCQERTLQIMLESWRRHTPRSLYWPPQASSTTTRWSGVVGVSLHYCGSPSPATLLQHFVLKIVPSDQPQQTRGQICTACRRTRLHQHQQSSRAVPGPRNIAMVPYQNVPRTCQPCKFLHGVHTWRTTLHAVSVMTVTKLGAPWTVPPKGRTTYAWSQLSTAALQCPHVLQQTQSPRAAPILLLPRHLALRPCIRLTQAPRKFPHGHGTAPTSQLTPASKTIRFSSLANLKLPAQAHVRLQGSLTSTVGSLATRGPLSEDPKEGPSGSCTVNCPHADLTKRHTLHQGAFLRAPSAPHLGSGSRNLAPLHCSFGT